MEIIAGRIKEYILALKETGHFTFEDMHAKSDVPVQTIRNICSGKTADSGFETIAKLVYSLGGDLNELVGYEKTKDIEVNSIITMKEIYETRIDDIINHYEQRMNDLKEMCEIRINDIHRCSEKRIADIKQYYEEQLKKGNA